MYNGHSGQEWVQHAFLDRLEQIAGSVLASWDSCDICSRAISLRWKQERRYIVELSCLKGPFSGGMPDSSGNAVLTYTLGSYNAS